MSGLISSLAFKSTTLVAEGRCLTENITFDFPMNKNLGFVFNGEADRFHFLQSLSLVKNMTQGEYLINGENVLEMTFEEFLPYRLKIGFAFATRGLLQNRSLRQNLLLPLEFHNLFPEKEREDWLEECMQYFDLHEDLDKRPSEVPASSQKAVLILRAFIHRPEWVILDTPETLLAKKHQGCLLQMIDDHRKNYGLKHLFFASQDEELSSCLADEYILVKKNQFKSVSPVHIQRGAA